MSLPVASSSAGTQRFTASIGFCQNITVAGLQLTINGTGGNTYLEFFSLPSGGTPTQLQVGSFGGTGQVQCSGSYYVDV